MGVNLSRDGNDNDVEEEALPSVTLKQLPQIHLGKPEIPVQICIIGAGAAGKANQPLEPH